MPPEKNDTDEELQPPADLFAEPRDCAMQWDVREIWPEPPTATDPGHSDLEKGSTSPV